MRHRLRCGRRDRGRRRHWHWRGHGQRRLAYAPALGSRNTIEAPGQAVLLAPAGVALRLSARRRGAVELPAVAVAANEHWRTTVLADESSSRNVPHAHPGKLPRVCWTGSSTGETLALHPLSHEKV